MEDLLMILITFIGMLLLLQLVFFELNRSKMKKANNVNWFLALNKPFRYTRVGYMVVLCIFCYMFSGMNDMFSASWFIYLILFTAMGVVSDAIVQYLILLYGKKRCHNEIEEAVLLQNELLEISQTMNEDDNYEESPKQYDEETILRQYVEPTDHLAFLSVDNGIFVNQYQPLPEATFDVEPYNGDIEALQLTFGDKPIKAVRLTPSGQLPFKDDKMNVIMCQYTNYDKNEVYRVLKDNGYFVVNQNGTANLKEIIQMYMPFGLKGSWDAYACAQTLESIGMKIIDKFEDYGTIRFYSLQALHNYFKKNSPDIADINKYQMFYLNALREINVKKYFELTTHRFLVVAQKTSHIVVE